MSQCVVDMDIGLGDNNMLSERECRAVDIQKCPKMSFARRIAKAIRSSNKILL
jgi:hypothetical protein